MALATKSASWRLPRGRAKQRERALLRYQALPREQVEAAFLDAVRGGQPAPRTSQVRALDDAELIRMTRRLQRLRSECGCQAGAWSMTGALLAAPVVAALHGVSGPVGVLVCVLLCAAAVIGAAITGKVITIAAYRLRWRIECRRVLRQLAERGTDQHVILR